MVCIDAPAEGTQIKSDFAIHGWGVAGAGVERVDVYHDGNKSIGSIKSLNERPDVDRTVNPDKIYKDAIHSGYSITVPVALLGEGKHSINVAVIALDGRVAWASRNIEI
jgi:hypothetical protein